MARILWLSLLVPYPPKGGVVQRSYHLLREVAKRHEVHLLAFDQPGRIRSSEELHVARQALEAFCTSVTVVRMPYASKFLPAFLSIFSPKPYTIVWALSDDMSAQIRNICSRWNIDLVHFDTMDLAGYINTVSLPSFLTHHNIESHMMHRRIKYERNIFKKAYFLLEGVKLRLYEARSCSLFKMNLTVSELDKSRLGKVCPSCAIDVIPNGVDTDYFKPAHIPSGDPYSLIFVGGSSWYPNYHAILYLLEEIWPCIYKHDSRFQLTIVGKHHPDVLRKLQEISKRFDNVRFTGWVDDVRPYLEESGIFICPIRDGGGTKLKILDALAMGKPIVAHPVACEGIDVIPERHVLLANTPQEFLTQVLRLTRDAELRKALASEGRKLIEEKYDFAVIGRKLGRIYAEAAELREGQ